MPKKKQNKHTHPKSTWDLGDPSMYDRKIHEPGKKPILIIDGMNLAHAAKHTYAKLSNKGTSVSMVFGVPSMIKSIIKRTGWNPQRVIVVWDGDRSKHRLEWLPEYKSHREEKPPEFYEQIERLKKLLYYMGIPQVNDPELEGDDAIAMLVKKCKLLSRTIIVSGDKDMLQLVNTHVEVYNQRTSNHWDLYTFSHGVYGLRPHQYVDYLCLVGDSSDDIPGVRGIGEVRGAQFLKQFGSVRKFLADDEATFTGMNNPKKVKRVWKRNRKLMDLNWYIRKYFKKHKLKYYQDKKFPIFNEEKFTRYCIKYNLRTFMSPSFKNFFQNIGQ